MLHVLVTVFLELAAARGVVAVLANFGTSSACRLTRPICSRCWPSRPAPTTPSSSSGAIRRPATTAWTERPPIYDMFRGHAHVIVGSGLTIAGAVCVPALHPAARTSRPGRTCRSRRARDVGGGADPGARGAGHRQPLRPVGAQARVRHGLAPRRHRHRAVAGPNPRRVSTGAVALIGLLALPGYKTSYDARPYLPDRARPTSATRPRNATSRRPGSTPNC